MPPNAYMTDMPKTQEKLKTRQITAVIINKLSLFKMKWNL